VIPRGDASVSTHTRRAAGAGRPSAAAFQESVASRLSNNGVIGTIQPTVVFVLVITNDPHRSCHLAVRTPVITNDPDHSRHLAVRTPVITNDPHRSRERAMRPSRRVDDLFVDQGEP
jgi:hypothetical protein